MLRKALTGPWKESSTRKYTLDHTSVEAFILLMKYMYTGVLTFKYHDLGDLSSPCDSFSDETSRLVSCTAQNLTLVELWVLADYLQIPRVCNLVVNQIKSSAKMCTTFTDSPNAVACAYKCSADDSVLRKLMAQIWAHDLEAMGLFKSALPKDLKDDVLKHLRDHAFIRLTDNTRDKHHVTEDEQHFSGATMEHEGWFDIGRES